ncbi:M3 family metallopeptidase [Blastococcus sp. Marseille-P5729]|uniref:M3 family metallopeptidase n=1 Tax=Blastococcus sp. Marseille-P5729 TaxID=2086582 RepID=UPI0018FED273|nr:M3 family metallopeptidase [Blastococcus sp. Marseille-P5729]
MNRSTPGRGTPTWRRTTYLTASGEHVGRIHLDLHPRDGKFKHAAQFSMVEVIESQQLPEGVLACNFSRGLMEHYVWSLVIAKDMSSAFDRDDLFTPTVATRYRDRVLAPGGTKDAADLVADLLSRPYSFDSFAAWLAE